jgi:hypothetical protein
VRNPWSRLVSAFVNKFVWLHDIIQPVLAEAHRRWGTVAPSWRDSLPKIFRGDYWKGIERLRTSIWPSLRGEAAWENEFTFRHFVEHVATEDLAGGDVDHHWRPQYRFLNNVPFNFVGRFERLPEGVQALTDRLGVRTGLPTANRTEYTPAKRRQRSYADCPLKKLRRLRAMPNYRRFYTPQLRDRVAELYQQDVEQFEYDFEESCDGPRNPSSLVRNAACTKSSWRAAG